MNRLTVDTDLNFCDIAKCSRTPGGSFCEDGYCDQRRCYERLREYERIGTVDQFRTALRRTAEHDKAMDEGRLVELPCRVGDMVYWMWTDGAGNCESPIYENRVYEICVTKSGVELSRGSHDGGLGMIGIHPPQAVFLTRQEAEAALDRGGEDFPPEEEDPDVSMTQPDGSPWPF